MAGNYLRNTFSKTDSFKSFPKVKEIVYSWVFLRSECSFSFLFLLLPNEHRNHLDVSVLSIKYSDPINAGQMYYWFNLVNSSIFCKGEIQEMNYVVGWNRKISPAFYYNFKVRTDVAKALLQHSLVMYLWYILWCQHIKKKRFESFGKTFSFMQ